MGEQEIELEQENIIITAGGAVNSVNGYTGDVVLTTSDLENTSDYQTGTEVESAISTAIAGKQDTLTAGNNITISNNTISATDTTYTAGTGLDLTGTTFSVDTATIATQQDVSNEATAREDADTNLQGQIDAISASSDVKDIVGTKAELNNYDTSTLGNNDIIKVLQDESENDATTYYRWNATTQQFALIGEEGPYYTKSQADTLLNAKQNTLTAGSNVQIVNDTISATDTTYADFTGTDGTAAGTAGLVPAPATTDAGKFLKADGTWDTAGGANIVQTTGTSTTDVMSQNATTSMIFADPSSRRKIGIGLNTVVYGTNGVAVGDSARAAADGSVAIGASAQTTAKGQVMIGTSVTSYGYNSSNYRLLSGVYDPQSAHDAATKGYVDGKVLTAAGAPTTATVGTVGQLYEDSTNGKLYICTDATNPYVWEEVGGGSGPTVVQTTGTSTTDVMSQKATTSMVYRNGATSKIQIGASSAATGSNYPIAIGPSATASGFSDSIAMGHYATASSNGAIAIGGGNTANDTDVEALAAGAIALGTGAKATQQGQMDIGSANDTSTGYNSSNYRLLTGLYDPQSAHDAANKEYVDSAIIQSGTAAPTTSTAAAVGALMATVESGTGHLYICTDDTGGTYTWQTLV